MSASPLRVGIAGYGVVVLVALMARIPPLERGIGADRLARWHAMGGRYSVSLVVAHGLLITWGYAVTAHTDATVYALNREPFLTAVCGHAATQRQAGRIADARLAAGAAPGSAEAPEPDTAEPG